MGPRGFADAGTEAELARRCRAPQAAGGYRARDPGRRGPRRGNAAPDDVLDAAVAARTADRVARGVAQSVPSPAELIDGRDVAILTSATSGPGGRSEARRPRCGSPKPAPSPPAATSARAPASASRPGAG
ncbi:MAG: DUF429 domain-containing protein [Chloroflexi bacterium]|nr:DUF429 domain-containing protein [Chloroflexota bacterium]